MNALERLGKKEIRELICKNWITHDAMWFAHTLRTAGIEQANRLNLAAIESMSAIEVLRLKKALKFPKETVETFDDLTDFLTRVMDVVLADFMHLSWTIPRKNVIHWKIADNQCFAFKGITRLGVIRDYECGVLHRLRCWFKTLGIDFQMDPEIRHCIMHTKGSCSGEFRFNLK